MNTKLFPEKSVSEECLWPIPRVCRWCGRCSRSLPWSQSHGTSASSLPSSWAPLHRVRTKRTSYHRHRPLLNTQRTSGLNSRLFRYCAKPKDYKRHPKQIDCSSNSTFLRAFWGRERLEDSLLFSSRRERLKDSVLFSSQRERLKDSVLFSSQRERLEDSVLFSSHRERLEDSVLFSSQRERLEDSVLFSSQITEREAPGLCSLLIPTIHKVWDVINMQEHWHHLK